MPQLSKSEVLSLDIKCEKQINDEKYKIISIKNNVQPNKCGKPNHLLTHVCSFRQILQHGFQNIQQSLIVSDEFLCIAVPLNILKTNIAYVFATPSKMKPQILLEQFSEKVMKI